MPIAFGSVERRFLLICKPNYPNNISKYFLGGFAPFLKETRVLVGITCEYMILYFFRTPLQIELGERTHGCDAEGHTYNFIVG
jgi:hypothetical protein